ncbi:hypothetical protein ACFYZH_13330 [Streptomyces abikoensis]|uniref:terpene synthase family protein n=1 Tax=Streptomyces abikoensis TaxID=97398 RepID=UPI00368FBC2F
MGKPLLFSESFEHDQLSLAGYRVPEFKAPFPVVLNPHHDFAEEAALRWAHSFRLDETPAAAQRLTDMACGMFSGLWCPRTDREGAVIMAEWIIWLFLWDDIFDDGPLGRDPTALQDALLQIDRALAEPPGQPDDTLTFPLARALADIWRALHARAPETVRKRFPASFRMYLRAMVDETNNRAAEVVPDLDTYLRLRRVNAATRSSLDLIEGLQGVDMPDALRHGLYGELRAFASELWVWTNDAYSLRKDLHYRNPHNLVLVLREARGLSLQEAADQVRLMVEQRMWDFIQVAERLRSLVDMPTDPHSMAKEAVLRGVQMLEDSISGFYRWQENALRYRRTSGFLVP